MDSLNIVYIVLAIIIFIGVSIAGSANLYFNEAVQKTKDLCSLGLPANEFAKQIISDRHLNVGVAKIKGKFTDSYNSKSKTLFISELLYDQFSTTAIAVTAHELGHAIADSQNSPMLKLKLLLAKFCYFLNRFIWVVLAASLICFFAIPEIPDVAFWLLVSAGIIFVIGILFKLITLSTELEASKIAVTLLKESDLDETEIKRSKKLFRAAATTYLADIFMPFVKILNFIGFILYNTIGRLFR